MSRKMVALLGSSVITALVGTVAQAKSTAPAKQSEKIQKETVRSSWPAENLSGKIAMVDPQKRLVVVRDSSGVPFDFVVRRSTRIDSGNERLKLRELASRKNDVVSIRYIPKRTGDVAQAIKLGQ